MAKDEGKKRRGCLRAILRWAFRALLLVVVLAAVAFVVVFRTALYNRFYAFPRQAAALAEIRGQRTGVALDDGWPEFRGICHSHSELSHDSEVSFPAIVQAAKMADISFVFMSDHCVDGVADYSLGWKGVHDGVLFVRGFEMGHGFMPWGLPDDTRLERDAEPEVLARAIEQAGGALFFAHPEQERRWDLPQLVGMEIYNLHADFADEEFSALVPDIILSLRAYPDQIIRSVFDPPTDLLERWDDLNKTRHITGIAGNDCHQNMGYRGYYTEKDTFLLRETSPDDIDEWRLNFVTRGLLRLLFGPLEPGKQLFRVDLDAYERSMRHVNTHVLARDCTEAALLDGLRKGRVFVAFDLLADARGFTFIAEGRNGKAVMGEAIPFQPELRLRAAAPSSCRFTVLRDGTRIGEYVGNAFDIEAESAGKYRIQADLRVLDEWVPWIYSNPIAVTAPDGVVEESASRASLAP